MEQMQVRYDGEIKRYKEKFQQENVLSVEELQLKIKSLEDTIEQMRLEHDTEFEKYTKAVKRGKVSLAGTAKERDLERKIDDLESTINIMRQKHREEVSILVINNDQSIVDNENSSINNAESVVNSDKTVVNNQN